MAVCKQQSPSRTELNNTFQNQSNINISKTVNLESLSKNEQIYIWSE